MKKFEIVGHTADAGIKVYGETLKELFENAAYGMFFLMFNDLETIPTKFQETIQIEADDLTTLLVAWLNELLYYYNLKNIIFSQFEIRKLKEKQLEAISKGARVNEKIPEMEIKAATYHNLKIERNSQGIYTTTIIFDI